MESESRKYNSLRNFIYGFGSQVVIGILNFVLRLVFVKVLGMEYHGINGLFASILTVLSLAELGFGNIVVFSLYQPIAEQDTKKISALIYFYRKIYCTIAMVVAVVGITIMPFLKFIVKTEQPVDRLALYYVLFLANTVVSYLFVYKTSLIRADQKQYVISKYTMLMQIGMACVQVILLLVSHNYIIYLCTQIVFTFLTNYFLSLKADQLYPYIKNSRFIIEDKEKRKIFHDVKAMFSYKVGGVLLNSTDNMFISAMVNTLSVGIYSNYLLIISFVNQFINVIYDALYSSVGNLNVTGTPEQQKRIFNVLVLGFSWIGSFCFVCLYELMNPFLSFFFGEAAVFSGNMVCVICINFYLPIILYPIWMYRNTTGLFQETRNILLYTAAINVFLSYILGKKIGILGIVAATSIARLITSFWFEPYILYKKGFHKNVMEYFIKQIKYVICIIISVNTIGLISKGICVEGLMDFILKCVLCVIIPNIILLIMTYKSDEFRYLVDTFWKRKKWGRKVKINE